MNKLMTIALLLVGMTASAQGTWTTKFEVQQDMLKDEPGGTYYKYAIDTLGAVIIRQGEEMKFRVESYSGSFCGFLSTTSGGWQVPYVEVRMGLYDGSGKLTEKLVTNIESDYSNGYCSAWPSENWITTPALRGKFKKMVSGMYSGDGYVRIVIKRMNKPDLDMKIKPLKNQ